VELFGVILMIGAGGALAIGVMIAIGVATKRYESGGTEPQQQPVPDRGRVAASILFNVLLLGGVAPEEALRQIRRRAGLAAPVTTGIDIASWGDRFLQWSSPEQRQWLLDMAVQLIAGEERAVPLRQYAALLDLTFALGFQTDALARLRERYGFEYVDHAKDGRPRDADRSRGTPLFMRDQRDRAELLRVLGIEGEASRQVIIATYRKLATQHHPDKHVGSEGEVQAEAAERFIEITRAYEILMAYDRD